MEAYAVIQTGGKQYRVLQGDVFDVERLPGEAGDAIALDHVLAISDGKSLKTGTPNLDGATVKVEVVSQFRGPKLVAFKKKRRKGYTRKVGHRQALTKIKVVELAG